MSRALHETINVPNAGIGDDQYPPQSAQNQAPHGVSTFVDGSGHIFSMYLEMATEEDKKMVENWKADADGTLIFTGLFSAAVASLISVSVQDIQQNPQDTSNFYLANIYQTLADPNGSNTSTSPPFSPPPFSPPNHAVWVNALWFLSLVISLTCALLATLLQQWARRYLKITQSRYSPHKRARIRAFFSEGIEKCLLPWAVETLPTLLHISLFLFFAGVVVFLCNVNLTIFRLVLSWVGLCTALYGCITCMPIIRHDSPYYTPLSLPAWQIVTGVLFLIFRLRQWFSFSVRFHYSTFRRFLYRAESCRKSLVRGMQKTAEETALNSPPEVDTRAFMWTFDCLDEDHELEHFFFGLPGFRSSTLVADPLPLLTIEDKWKISEALHGLLVRTLSSDLLPVPVKNRRAMICAKALDPEHTPDVIDILNLILSNCQYGGLLATGIVQIVRAWISDSDEGIVPVAEATLSTIIARMLPRDDSWFIFASSQLSISEASFRDYAAHGDSLSLVILIHLVRQQFNYFRKPSWYYGNFAAILEEASNFNVTHTSPKLQHEFCALWNQIVKKVQDCGDRDMVIFLLRPIRNVYLALHQDTDSAPTLFSTSTGDEDYVLLQPFSYPVCKVPGHHSDSIPLIRDGHASTTIIPTVPHDHNNTALVPSLATPDPLPVNESFKDVLPLDNQISVPVSTRNIDQTTTESALILTTSPSPVAACTFRGSIDLSLRTMPHSALEPPALNPPPKSNASASPPEHVPAGHTALGCTPSGALNILTATSPMPVLDDMLPTESHPSILSTAAEGEGSTKVGLSMEMDASYSAVDTAIREDITVTADLPPLLPSSSPVTDVAIDDPSTRSLGTETCPLGPVQSSYDIVERIIYQCQMSKQ
ncbi:hypothetical protein V8E53_001682 [Lactarius tabidus]